MPAYFLTLSLTHSQSKPHFVMRQIEREREREREREKEREKERWWCESENKFISTAGSVSKKAWSRRRRRQQHCGYIFGRGNWTVVGSNEASQAAAAAGGTPPLIAGLRQPYWLQLPGKGLPHTSLAWERSRAAMDTLRVRIPREKKSSAWERAGARRRTRRSQFALKKTINGILYHVWMSHGKIGPRPQGVNLLEGGGELLCYGCHLCDEIFLSKREFISLSLSLSMGLSATHSKGTMFEF